MMQKGLKGTAKPLFGGSIPPAASNIKAIQRKITFLGFEFLLQIYCNELRKTNPAIS